MARADDGSASTYIDPAATNSTSSAPVAATGASTTSCSTSSTTTSCTKSTTTTSCTSTTSSTSCTKTLSHSSTSAPVPSSMPPPSTSAAPAIDDKQKYRLNRLLKRQDVAAPATRASASDDSMDLADTRSNGATAVSVSGPGTHIAAAAFAVAGALLYAYV
ncbi:hypothetical protein CAUPRSCDRAFT_12972 [Caulochytrium protostelioides]|uniref:Uncharacterized protein n=1 Tax=Caulochytrium protostelioides TaxID=1555241 RepID=A0A4P9WRR3_9FUNG|nr:hypothetical protein CAUPRSCDRAFT_12972 [Caulochytrium protostelioides]